MIVIISLLFIWPEKVSEFSLCRLLRSFSLPEPSAASVAGCRWGRCRGACPPTRATYSSPFGAVLGVQMYPNWRASSGAQLMGELISVAVCARAASLARLQLIQLLAGNDRRH